MRCGTYVSCNWTKPLAQWGSAAKIAGLGEIRGASCLKMEELQPSLQTGASHDRPGNEPVRRRMIEDMAIRKFAPKTQHDYLQRVKKFAAYLGRSPATANPEDVRRYQLRLTASGVGVPTINQTVSTLRFFFKVKVTLRRPDLVERPTFVSEPRKLPVVLSPEEAVRLLDAAPGLKYKAELSVAYGAG